MELRIEGLETLIKRVVKETVAELSASSDIAATPAPSSIGPVPRDDDLLTTAEAAHEVGLKKSTLDRKRVDGSGPPYRKISPRCIRYRRLELRAWVEARAARNTGEAALGDGT